MSSGFEWPEHDTDYTNPENPASRMVNSNNWVQFVLNKPVVQEPGSVFNYNSGCSYLLMAALSKVGLDVEDFAQKNLFTPLGISSTEYMWVKVDFPKRILNGSHGLYMRPRDMAKFGYLYLKGGFWGERQIIPKAWVEESTKEQIKITGKIGLLASNYGYQWYIQPYGFHSRGYGGQYIFIIPKYELVVVFTSTLLRPQMGIPVNLVKRKILPAIQSLKPLSENEKATDILKSEIESFNKKHGILH